jgi:hypothetical protein
VSDFALKTATSGECKYDLYAVSNHYGGLRSGHYTAVCKNPVVERWFKFDDHNPIEHRQRVTANLEARNRGNDRGAAQQQRRRLAAIGDWAIFKDK